VSAKKYRGQIATIYGNFDQKDVPRVRAAIEAGWTKIGYCFDGKIRGLPPLAQSPMDYEEIPAIRTKK